MNLLRILFEHHMLSVKIGQRAGVSYAHFTGARACVSGFGETIKDALWDAISRFPGGVA